MATIILSSKRVDKDGGEEEEVREPPTIDSFELLKPLSSGAYGTVYLGRKRIPPKHVYAIKVLKKSDLIRKNMTSQVVQERSALVSSHSNEFCVKLYYSLQTHTHVYFVMEYCAGGDLKSLLKHMRFFPLEMATFYVAEVACALDYLHKRGIVHRDIKPDNMLVDKLGHVKLTDFGLSDVGVQRMLGKEEQQRVTAYSPPNQDKYTPGQIASLAQGITFSQCESPVFNTSSGSTDQFFSASGSNSNSNESKQHGETPVGFAGGAPGAVVHVNKRKMRIPLRKLGSRGNLSTTTTNLSATTSTSSLSVSNNNTPPPRDSTTFSSRECSSVSSSWSIINTPPPKVSSGNEDQMTYKRVKLSPKKGKKKGFEFNDSSFLSVSFSFAKNAPAKKPTTLSLRGPHLSSSPIPSSSSELVTTPTFRFSSPNHNNNNNNSTELFNAEFSPVVLREEAKENSSAVLRLNNTFHHTQSELHGSGMVIMSPEKGRFRDERSTQFHQYSSSLPVIVTNQCGGNNNANTNNHHVSTTPVEDSRFHNINAAVPTTTATKSPSWPWQIFQSRKRKWDGQQHTGLTGDVGELLLEATPPARTARTDESRSGGGGSSSNNRVRILGTPDYLAPELVRIAMGEESAGVGFPSDWWSLGVCFYEFVIGVLPFNDDTPDLIFKNIVNREVEYPEGIDNAVLTLIDGLLSLEQESRFGFNQLKETQFLPVFGMESVEQWDQFGGRVPPFVPVVDGELDTGYFE